MFVFVNTNILLLPQNKILILNCKHIKYNSRHSVNNYLSLYIFNCNCAVKCNLHIFEKLLYIFLFYSNYHITYI